MLCWVIEVTYLDMFYWQIPIAQEQVIDLIIKLKTTPVATNLLETMIDEALPTRAESWYHSTLKQGAKGLVLAAETAMEKICRVCCFFRKKYKSFFKK